MKMPKIKSLILVGGIAANLALIITLCVVVRNNVVYPSVEYVKPDDTGTIELTSTSYTINQKTLYEYSYFDASLSFENSPFHQVQCDELKIEIGDSFEVGDVIGTADGSNVVAEHNGCVVDFESASGASTLYYYGQFQIEVPITMDQYYNIDFKNLTSPVMYLGNETVFPLEFDHFDFSKLESSQESYVYYSIGECRMVLNEKSNIQVRAVDKIYSDVFCVDANAFPNQSTSRYFYSVDGDGKVYSLSLSVSKFVNGNAIVYGEKIHEGMVIYER